MTATRIWQSGWETGDVGELDIDGTFGTATGSITTLNLKTGARALNPSMGGHGKAYTTSQCRVAFHLYHSGTNSAQAKLAYVTGATRVEVEIDHATQLLRILVGGTVVASISLTSAGLTANVYHHIGVNFKAATSGGYCTIYIDGVQKLQYVGNTGSSYSGAWHAAGTNGGPLVNYTVDDGYADDIAGETDTAPPVLQFGYGIADSAGNYTNWTPSAGSNYQNVDDVAGVHDGDTTYNKTLATATKDSYGTANFTIPAGYTVQAVIPLVVARKTGAEDCKLKVGLRESATDANGAEQVLGTGYTYLFQRYTTRPGGGAWNQTAINAAEVLIESAGTFA